MKQRLIAKIEDLTRKYKHENKDVAVAWLGWRRNTAEDYKRVFNNVQSCYLGTYSIEDPNVLHDGNAPTVCNTIIGEIEGYSLFALVMADYGNHAPNVLRFADKDVCLMDLADELQDVIDTEESKLEEELGDLK